MRELKKVQRVREPQIPIKLVGIGETVEDLQPFDPIEFIEAMFG